MAICNTAVKMMINLLGHEDGMHIYHLAKKAEIMERKNSDDLQKAIKETINKISKAIHSTGRLPRDLTKYMDAIDDAVMQMYFNTCYDAIRTGNKRAPSVRMAKLPKGTIPSSLLDLRRKYDLYKKKKEMTPRQRQIADSLKKAYVKRVQSVWEKKSEPFREGEKPTLSEVKEFISQAAKVPAARANTISATETTRYYNEERVKRYSGSNDFTHFLYLAIRDHRTTKWCRTRHHKIFTKGTKLFEDNVPPCFTGDSPVLSTKGWVRIDSIVIGDYVWTHEKRWREVTDVHCTHKEQARLFQIGYSLATNNHPYLERSGEFVKAEHFNPKEGVWSISHNLQDVWSATMDAIQQKRPIFLLKYLLQWTLGAYTERSWTSKLQGQKDRQNWVHPHTSTRSPIQMLSRICSRTQACYGKAFGSLFKKIRGGTSHQSQALGQQDREFASDDSIRTRHVALQGCAKEKVKVYNLEVDQDHTYVSGGYVVHNCHWSCRSEIVPLSPLVQKHRDLIEDKTNHATASNIEPLPKDWTS